MNGLTLLDAVLACPELVWLATEEEKRVHLAALTGMPAGKLPHDVRGSASTKRVQLFPDHVPIGIDLHGRWVFLYLATDNELDRFRFFLQRHLDLFSQLPAWTLRIVVPPHLKTLADICQEVARSEFARPIDERLVKMLGSYLKRRQAHEQGVPSRTRKSMTRRFLHSGRPGTRCSTGVGCASVKLRSTGVHHPPLRTRSRATLAPSRVSFCPISIDT